MILLIWDWLKLNLGVSYRRAIQIPGRIGKIKGVKPISFLFVSHVNVFSLENFMI